MTQTRQQYRLNFLTSQMHELLPVYFDAPDIGILFDLQQARGLVDAAVPEGPPWHTDPKGGTFPRTSGRLSQFSVALQEQDNWCWAAVSTSVSRFFDPASTWTQCSLASNQLNLECCLDASSCNETWTLDEPLRAVGCLESYAAGPTSFEVIRDRIDAGYPVCCHINWDNGQGGHFVAIGGWTDGSSGTRYLDIYDPLIGYKQEVYDHFVSSYRDMGVWDYSYYVQRPIV